VDRRIRFTNFYEHPEDSRFYVYEFFHEYIADYFEELLVSRGVTFERHFAVDSDPQVYLFGIAKSYLSESNKCNYLTHAHFRKPLIANVWLKWATLIITLGLVALALVGYLQSR
jgi:hypothetical protein